MTSPSKGFSIERSVARLFRRRIDGVRVTPWQIVLLGVILLTLGGGAQEPPVQSGAQGLPTQGGGVVQPTADTHNCPEARPSTMGPTNPQGQPWERAENDGGLAGC